MHSLVVDALGHLGPKRPIFHSEADFQIALAIEIGIRNPDVSVWAEAVLIEDANLKLDILMRGGSQLHGVELKLHKHKFAMTLDGEVYRYPDGNPRDTSRVRLLHDIARLERFKSNGPNRSGTVVMLTNYQLWAPHGAGATDFEFSLCEGRTVTGELRWSDKTAQRTRDANPNVTLAGQYGFLWRDYSRVDAAAGEFRVLCVEV